MKLEKSKKALIIVAHPDDETVWMGGTILKNPEIDWTIFSLCRSRDTDRAPKFKKVCDYYGAKSIITDLDDENDIEIEKVVKDVKKILKEELSGSIYDYIFTHGQDGEYGHERHVAVHVAIAQLLEEGDLKCEEIYCFNYKKENEDEEFSQMIPGKDSDLVVELSQEEYSKKRYDIMAGIYGFEPDGPDAMYSTRIEAFKIIKK